MSFIIREKWIWIIIGACLLVLTGPYVLMWMILQMPDILRACTIWFLIFGWAIAAGYKDWLMDRRKRRRLTSSLG
jgi:hypothetical protein